MERFKEWFSKTFNAIKEKWLSLAVRTRIVALAVAGVVVVSAIVITVVLNTSSQEILCKTSGRDEAVQIVNALASEGIDARINNNNDVLVSDRDSLTARRVISEQELLRPGFNYDTWNNNIGMFSTDTEMNEAIKHQLQDWIMAYLNNIPEVESSMVILHIPKTKNYVMIENKNDTRASVSVTLKPGATLDNKQIKGIHEFIRTSVDGLEEHNINVTTGGGVLLIPDDGSAFGNEDLALRQRRLQMEVEYKELMGRNAAAQLGPIFDTVLREGNYTFAVDVEMDFSSNKEVMDLTYTPVVGIDSGIISDVVREYAAGGTAAEGGAIGTFPNAPIAPDYPTVPDIMEGNEFYVEWVERTNYKINERLETYKDDGLRRIKTTASLVINSEPVPPADLDVWAEIVASAIGADVEDISVMAIPFQLPPTPEVPGSGDTPTPFRNALIYIIIALGVLLIVLLVLALNTSGSKKKRQIRYRGTAPAADGLGGYLKDDSYQAPPMEQESFDLPSLLDENETKDVVLKREIKEFSKSNPEIIAQLIRTWLREEEVQ